MAYTIKSLKNMLNITLSGITEDPSIPVDKKCNIIIHATALVCALVAIQPIPFADLFVLTPIQVIMVIFLSRAMGNPLGENKAKEMVIYIVGVVGWGVLAQQVVLGLYKTILPFMGALTSMPLVYAATYGLGYASKTILEARSKDQKISETELKRISKLAAEKAKKEQKNINKDSILKELESWKEKGLKYQQYKEQVNKEGNKVKELERKNQIFEKQLNELEEKLKLSVSTEEWTRVLEEEDLKTTKLQNELKEHRNLKEELSKTKEKLNETTNKRYKTIQDRFQRLYPNIKLNDKIYKELAILSNERLHSLEYQIGLLQHTPNKVNYRDKIQGISKKTIHEIGFDKDGRMYVSHEGNIITIYRVGDKGSQQLDIDWLKKAI
ncbi:YcjF family protein [Neobacillus niacini]|uniref:YcjF family protein n=1 Tax=Neobacillus niacini TaxID=86668 RepID=UPI0021CB47E9|nr:hypothetical protein [Neobacillus niacini]MCM3763877.1 hypothetical protein [Neobacillus niacini]